MIQDPVIRNDASVKLAHQALTDVIDAMLIVSLVEFGHSPLFVLRLGEIPNMMILPDIM